MDACIREWRVPYNNHWTVNLDQSGTLTPIIVSLLALDLVIWLQFDGNKGGVNKCYRRWCIKLLSIKIILLATTAQLQPLFTTNKLQVGALFPTSQSQNSVVVWLSVRYFQGNTALVSRYHSLLMISTRCWRLPFNQLSNLLFFNTRSPKTGLEERAVLNLRCNCNYT